VDPNVEIPPEAEQTVPTLQLSVIIPARNESRSLPACLDSLVVQSEPGFALGQQWQIILINDDSTDTTLTIANEVAATHPGIIVLSTPPLDLSDRGGFTGKNAACWLGAQQALGRWFLFTDADTVHQPGDLSRAIHEAEKYHAVLLSYSPKQIVTGFWQRAVMPLVFSELASVYSMKQVNDPNDRLAAANGQFLLVERNTYFVTGGHRAIGPNILEDVALARNIKRNGRNIRFRYAPDALSAFMYRSTHEMIEGWTKNLALLMPRPIALALWRILDLLLFFGLPILALTLPPHVPYQPVILMLLWARTLWRFYSRAARSNFPAADVILSILGVPLFVYLLIRSYTHHRIQKSVTWKGRTYTTNN
jgi:glycosyltransferase involved in cell wall biosynthesis